MHDLTLKAFFLAMQLKTVLSVSCTYTVVTPTNFTNFSIRKMIDAVRSSSSTLASYLSLQCKRVLVTMPEAVLTDRQSTCNGVDIYHLQTVRQTTMT